jgi:dipeptidyl aminopeptidase/acylaminoacyl peptidase
MKTRILIGVIFVIVIAAGSTILAWKSMPTLKEISPQPGAVEIPATSPIRLVFSRAMQEATVRERIKIDPSIEGSFTWDKNSLIFTPNQPWPGGQLINLQLEAGARSTNWISFPMGKQSWSFTTSGEIMAYLWPSNGKADIYALNPLTGEIHQFTFGMGVLDYSASRDGMIVYFSASNFEGGANLYRIDRTRLEGAPDKPYEAEELLRCGTAQCRSPVVSFDNHYLAYEYVLPAPSGDLGLAQIWLMDLTSVEESPIGEPAHETVQPGWSQAGLLAYYDRTASWYELVNPITLMRIQLPNQTGQPGVWNPASEYYLAPEMSYLQAAGGTETGMSHLIRYNVQGNTTEDLTGEYKVEDVEADYSPDGSLISFTRKYLDADNWSFGRQIWIMNADGTNPHAITDEADYNHYDLAWRRDGRMIGYVRFNQAKLSEPPELWMVNADGSNPIQLVIGGYSPLWIP